MLVHEWLPAALQQATVKDVSGESWYLFGHCTEVTALPGAPAQWASIFARFGAKLESVNVGCCGMAGTYGHEVKTTRTRSVSMSCRGIRRCSVCRGTVVRPRLPCRSRETG